MINIQIDAPKHNGNALLSFLTDYVRPGHVLYLPVLLIPAGRHPSLLLILPLVMSMA